MMIIIDLQNSDTWKIQLTIAVNFTSSKVSEGKRAMHSRSKNIKFTSYNDANKVVDELFETICSKCQGNFETSMRRSDLYFFQFN